MPVKVLRRPQAAEDAESIADYLAKESLELAIHFLESVEQTLERLAEFPGLGSNYDVAHPDLVGLRVCSVEHFPNHLIFYVEHTGAIEIIRIRHGAQDIGAKSFHGER